MADHSSHARHDRFAVADAVGGGMLPVTIHGCPACGTLYADLLRLQHAVRHAWTPARPRDLRLSLADATRLQRGRWRRWLAGIGGQRDALTRPLALTVTGLGLAGLLLTALPPLSFGSAGAMAPVEKHVAAMAADPGASPAASAAGPGDPAGSPSPIDASKARNGVGSDPERQSEVLRPVLPLSFVLLGVGMGLFTLRRIAAAMRPVR